jgi:hypothetical protein
MSGTAGVLMITGSVVFLAGAAIAVPRVFTVPDSQSRVRLLEEHRMLWRLGQPGYALGALLAALGVGGLAADAAAPASRWLAAASVLLVVGSLFWSWAVYLRALRPADFALGRLPGWPFAAYVSLTIAGLPLLGAGLLAGEWPAWTGWLALGLDAVFLAVFARYRDLPPFVFYLLLGVVGVGVL